MLFLSFMVTILEVKHLTLSSRMHLRLGNYKIHKGGELNQWASNWKIIQILTFKGKEMVAYIESLAWRYFLHLWDFQKDEEEVLLADCEILCVCDATIVNPSVHFLSTQKLMSLNNRI